MSNDYEQVKKWRKNARLRLREISGGKCQCCGYDKCKEALEFHHVNPSTKDFTIGQLKIIKWEKLKEEIQKCVLVCANCHREIHYGYRECPEPIVINDHDYNPLRSNKEDKWVLEWDKINLEEELKNLTIKQFADKHNISESCVSLQIKKQKIIYKRKNIIKIDGLEKNTLEKLIQEMPYEKIGEIYGVTGNAIRKRAKKLGILLPKNRRGYWQKIKK